MLGKEGRRATFAQHRRCLAMSRPLVKLLRLRRHSVYEQLRLEEALLRASESNWCLLNDGAAQPAVVMGISGKAEELLHVEEVKKRNLQVIRRFSGGGTVVVDENTVFSTFVFNQNEVDGVDPFPNHIMDWTGVVYKQVFPAHTEYTLRENDYVFGQKKIGGNAQSIIKNRWLHHTSFLWDYHPENMALLRPPRKQPKYRKHRAHTEFITKLNEHLNCRLEFMEDVTKSLQRMGYDVEESTLEEAQSLLRRKHLHSTKLVDLADHVILERAEQIAV